MLAWLLVAASATQASPAPSAESVGQAYYLYVQGRTLDDGNDLPGAEAKYREALALLPNAAELHAELAGVYAEEGKLDDAQAEATKGLSLDADNRSAHRVLGLVQATTAQRTTPEDARRAQLASAASHLTRAVAGGVQIGRAHV